MSIAATALGRLSRFCRVFDAPSPSGAAARLFAWTLLMAALTAAIAQRLEPAGIPLGISLFALMAGLAVAGLRSGYPHARLGLCNIVTLSRAALASSLVAPLAVPEPIGNVDAWLVVSVATIALALDGIDGWLARRSGLASSFGARFDMEVDAALGLILALLVLDSGKLGSWVLVLGAMRYVYVAAGLAVPWLNGSLPEAFRRKAICVVQIAALIVLNAPAVSGPPAALLAAAATLALGWSFAIDIVWLARRRTS
ncbi:CDP-alcohol phosphatidyltransferase family protein [Kaistia geumhonensis]|uniref:Phosphatidylglycerophosphate synthase n=1 Tax=Kaistia geumhonensis TaxID=410839 RepID=A0ABU0M116_9HYPH|nr:CDP-alcohol phosphatidyltransferase family protein [Kaistia geumhonensis]MCX5480124.1 CDP-alcohol phosphatidyltransferase family protein [Kaistia geumhonensis]MDQ0514647.1 phosphatidylglycerophosphate synthase [Kaistia geumhonensis]